ncbi:hypothetical protein D3C72_1998720 [compost metagenome]
MRDALPSDWLGAEAVASGLVFDTLGGRLSPRQMAAVLRAALAQSPNVEVVEGAGVRAIHPGKGRAELDNGAEISFGHCVLAAGVGSFALVEALSGPLSGPSGMGVKGQAALLLADIDPQLPVIFTDGVYIVAHDDGHVAIGSTSENTRACRPIS